MSENTNHKLQDFIIVTGMSGAGKTQVIHVLEDMGFYCVDNLPPMLLLQFADLCARTKSQVSKVAAVIDIRGERFTENFADQVNTLKQYGFTPRLIFLESSEEILVRRFKETRRRHPLAGRHRSLLESIRLERKHLESLREIADKVIDTSQNSTKALKDEIISLIDEDKTCEGMLVNVMSFGFKYGLPTDADLVFDVRFLKNPHYIPELREHTGAEKEVEDYVMTDPDAPLFLEKLKDFIDFTVPRYSCEGKSYLTIAIGCTGGRHRSVLYARKIVEHISNQGYRAVLEHRDWKK
jgi:UPF0042 nucleotide-binding protein